MDRELWYITTVSVVLIVGVFMYGIILMGRPSDQKSSTGTLSATESTWTGLSLISVNVLIPVDDTQQGLV